MVLTYALLCRRDRYATGLTLSEATATAEHHMTACPQEAPLPAGPVTWHETPDGVLCAAVDGQWIGHHLRPEPVTYTEWRVTGQPPGFPPYSHTWSPQTLRHIDDHEAAARAFVDNIRRPDHEPWLDGPHLTSRVVTIQPWKHHT